MAKTRLLKAYDDYYAKYIDNSASVDKIILINGHSRGGAIANILGDYFENKCQTPNIKPFTYTLASPNVTAITPTNGETTIFNIVNRDDVVALIPGNISLFYKYGQDVAMSVHDDTGISGDLLKDVFENKSGYGAYNGNDPDDVDDLIEAMSMLIEDRESAYTLNTPESKEYRKLGSYDTYEEASADIPNFEARLENNKLNYYAGEKGVEKDEDTGLYYIKFKCCAAFLMQDISNFVFVYNFDETKYQPSLGYNLDLLNLLKEVLGVVSGVQHSHI